MNKLFTKIAAASLSLAMAVGVGIAVSRNAKDAIETKAASQYTATLAQSSSTANYTDSKGNTWTLDYVSNDSVSVDASTWLKTGTNSKAATSISLETSAYSSYVIDKITIHVKAKASTGSLGKIYIADELVEESPSALANSDTTLIYDNSTAKKSGAIKVAVERPSSQNGALYLGTVIVEYSDAPSSNPTITLSDSDLVVPLNGNASFTVTTSNLKENFSITGGDSNYFTMSFTPSSTDGDHAVTLHGEAATSSAIVLTVSSLDATSRTINITVMEDIVYEKVTNSSELKAGKQFIIVSVGDDYVMGAYSSGNSSPALSCAIGSDNKFHSISLPTGYAILTLSGNSSAWTISDQNNNKYYGESGENRLKASSSATDTWTISIDSSSNEATITSAASSRWIARNTSSPAFSTYANTGQTEVYIYMIPSTDPAISVSVTSGSTSMVGGDSATLTAELLNGATGTVNWAKSNNNITLSDETGLTTTVTSVASGSSTVTASLTNGSTVDPIDIVFTIRGGSETVPYTVAEARAAIDAGEGLTDVYTHGIVSQVDSFNSTYGSITYWISDDGTTTNQLEVYSGLDLNGAQFTDINGVMLGDTVTVFGTLKKYGSTYEYDKNNYLTSHTHASVTVTSIDSITGTLDAVLGTEEWDLSGLVVNGTLNNGSTQDITNYVTKSTSTAVPTTASTITVDVVITAKSDYGTATETIGVSGTVREVTGPLTDGGRYYIMNSTKTYGLSAEEAASESPVAVDLSSSNNLTAFDVKLTDNNSYEITTTINGVKYYLVCNTTATSSANNSIRITSNPASGLVSKSWVLDNTGVETSGSYHVSENTVGSTQRYLAYYTDNTTKWDWRGYLNLNNGDPEIQFVAEKSYAEGVADKILESCTSRGSSSYDTTAWGNASSAYAAITIEAEKNFLKNGDAVKDSLVKLERALEQYDYAISRYEGIDAFITGRTGIYGLANNVSLFAGISTEATTAIIVVVALTSVTAIGAIFFIKRRKYN